MTLEIQQKGLRKPLSVTVDPETLATLDLLRGEVPRSRFVEKALIQRFERELDDKKNRADE